MPSQVKSGTHEGLVLGEMHVGIHDGVHVLPELGPTSKTRPHALMQREANVAVPTDKWHRIEAKLGASHGVSVLPERVRHRLTTALKKKTA